MNRWKTSVPHNHETSLVKTIGATSMILTYTISIIRLVNIISTTSKFIKQPVHKKPVKNVN
jgi:hypothetical protein